MAQAALACRECDAGRQPAVVEELPQELRARVLDHAEGNPFYVEEILRSLIDGGIIVHDPVTHRWRATQDVADLPLPDTLHGVLAARIDRLTGETKRVLQLAAVIGRVFACPVLSAVHSPLPPLRSAEAAREPETRAHGSPVDPDFLSHLVALERAQLVREQARLPEREYVLKHVLTQEAAYASLLRRERRTAHRLVAESLEQLYPDRLEEQLGLLAYHWERAGEIERAVECLQRAGEQAAAQYANDEAIDYFTRALRLVPETADAGSHPELVERHYALLLAREAVYDLQMMREAHRRDLEALATLASTSAQDGKRAVVASRQAHYALMIRDHPA